MGFLKRLFRRMLREGTMPPGTSSFEHLSEEELEAHMRVARYGEFVLSDAVRPSYDLQVVPCQGYRHDRYRDEQARIDVPVLMAAVSCERIFDTFLDLLDPLGPVVDVVLESSHQQQRQRHTDFYREHIDLPVLKSIFYDYEDLLLNDGCAGVAVLNPAIPLEVQFDEHKLLIIYGEDLTPFEEILLQHGVRRDETIRFITEAEHVHSSSDRYAQQFEELKFRLGMDSYDYAASF